MLVYNFSKGQQCLFTFPASFAIFTAVTKYASMSSIIILLFLSVVSFTFRTKNN